MEDERTSTVHHSSFLKNEDFADHQQSKSEPAEQISKKPEAQDPIPLPLFDLKAELTGKINLAQQQNAFALLHRLRLVNNSDDAISGFQVKATCDPEFLTPKTWHVEKLPAKGQLDIQDLDIMISRSFMAGLKEAMRGTLGFEVIIPGKEPLTFDYPIELLAAEEWGGLDHLPDLTAAFCLPNDSAVEKVLKKAAGILHGAGLGSSDGYQSGSRKKVWQIVAAVYGALTTWGIDYATPPSSFEKQGQKTRTPTRVLESGLGTCLDLTLFLASCLEQCGLNPLVVIIEGHALVGCWLVDNDFSATVIDDCQALRKRVELGEIVMIESTNLCKASAASFSQATQNGAHHLENQDAFLCALDINRARMNAIRPLMDQVPLQENLPQQEAPSAAPILEEPPDLPPMEYHSEQKEEPDTPDARVENWKRKLLDLTLRNRLLNFKDTKQTIPLFCPNPAMLEDALAEGKKFKFVVMPEVMEGSDPRNSELHRRRMQQDAKTEFARLALGRKELLAEVTAREMENRLTALFRQARNHIEEGGANTLFLAMGFLHWTQPQRLDRTLKAPLLLLPVSIERKSIRSGFRLTLHDDDPRFNPTLLELLRKDFNLHLPEFEGDLPTDESGLDVSGIWNLMRHKVRDIQGWEVTEKVCLGTFSFTKYLMWKDLQDRLDQLKQNQVVRHLVDTPKDIYSDGDDFPQANTLDSNYPPDASYCPMLADSSQLAAVFAAAGGKDFVLVGPPGTGKSQTITNVIAHCLAEGKSVLFVSEKKAALDVVYRRLCQVGLGEFCLELHSAKARKLEVLEQLRQAWDARAHFDEHAWQDRAHKLAKLRTELNELPKVLHKRHSNGLTPYVALGKTIRHKDIPQIDFPWPAAKNHSTEELEKHRDTIRKLETAAAEVANLANSPLMAIKHTQWSPSWQDSLMELAGELHDNLKSLLAHYHSYQQTLRIPINISSARNIRLMIFLSELLEKAPGDESKFAFLPNCRSLITALQDMIALGEERNQCFTGLSTTYQPEATALDLASLWAAWQEAEDRRWPKSWLLRRGVLKNLGTKTAKGKRPDKSRAPKDLELLTRACELENQIGAITKEKQELGSYWQCPDTNWDYAKQAVSFAQRITRILEELSQGEPEKFIGLRTALLKLSNEARDLLEPGGAIFAKWQELKTQWTDFDSCLRKIQEHATLDDALVDGCLQGQEDLAGSLQLAEGWLAHAHGLRDWCFFQYVSRQAHAQGLVPVVVALISGELIPGNLLQTFEVNYCRWWLKGVLEKNPLLLNFRGSLHNQQIHRFQKLDQDLMQLNQMCIRDRILAAGHRPSRSSNGSGTQWGVLQREQTKKTRHMPLRKLMAQIPDVVSKLTPCMLMSPLSIAQYLSTDASIFDLVIFDEASQIPVWDAVGAMARAKQCIVVGDPKQLPPTSFFSRADDEDIDQEIEDLESILDECVGASLPQMQLRWHYRSRHESLILFSNSQYYHGKLISFPSATTDDTAVKYFNVPDGLYEKGKSRVNREEARAVVEAVVTWLRDDGFNAQGWSLGVVTFNQQQQILIEDLLDEERRQDASLERHFSSDLSEPVFVKNLENVQGDERDIIIFSITYGPDQNGKISMNFGPLNRDGGERRLNVAITRARRALQVYGTLQPDHISLSRTKARGVRDFKHFLEFAQNGPQAFASAVAAPGDGYDSEFEEEVAYFLEQKGWEVHPQVGVSGYRIDLGIVHPDNPGSYLAGVECDGATYHSSATARDRDRLRELVLRGLGWVMVRVWSTDWWHDSSGTAAKLHEKLEEILEHARSKPEPNTVITQPDIPVEPAPLQEAPFKPRNENRLIASAPSNTKNELPDKHYFQAAIPENASHTPLISDEFYYPSQRGNLSAMISHVVEIEGPIEQGLLVQRIAKAYGFSRSGQKMVKYISSIAKSISQSMFDGDRVFYWSRGTDPRTWDGFRLNPEGCERLRDAEHICSQELINMAKFVKDTDCPLGDDEMLKCLANRLGYKQMSRKVKECLRRAVLN